MSASNGSPRHNPVKGGGGERKDVKGVLTKQMDPQKEHRFK